MGKKISKRLKSLTTLAVLGSMMVTSLPTYAITYKDEQGQLITIDEFKDVQNHWARSIIREWNDLGVVNGDEKGKFNPNANITRGDLACIVERLLGLTDSAINNFVDLPAGKYYTNSVLRMNAAGLLSGDGKYLRPNANATREEVACILARAFKIDTSAYNSSYTGFVDDYNVSNWARGSIKAMYKLGYIKGTGNGKFEPKRPITRAEVVAIIDKICDSYYTQVSGVTDNTFTNNINGNAVVSRSGLTLSRSVISGNLYMTQSCNSIILDLTELKGDMVVLGNNARITVNDGCVLGDLYLYGKTTIEGAESFETIHVDRFATNSSLDEIPKNIVLYPKSSIRVANTELTNDSSTDSISYTEKEIKNLISKDKNTVDGGPEFSKGDITISYDNIVTAKDVALQTSGEADLKEIGIIWNKSNKTPTLDDCDGREEYDGFNSNGVDFVACTQRRDEVYTYRLYAINEKGLIGYMNPVAIRSYDFDIDMKVVQTSNGVRPEVQLYGTSVPKIRSVELKYDYSHLYTEGKPTGNGSRDMTVENNNSQDYQQYRYTYNVLLNDEVPPTHYGYIIEFENAGTIDKFPVLSNVTPDSIKPVESIKTGTGSQSGTYVYVKDNEIKTAYVDVQEYGVVYKEVSNGATNVGSPDATSSNWKREGEGYEIPNKTTEKYSCSFSVRSSYTDVYYASYVKTADGYYYGELKSLASLSSEGDINGPNVSSLNAVRLDNNTAIVTLNYESGSDLDGAKYGAITLKNGKGEVVSKYNGGSLASANYWVSLGKDKIALTFTGLQSGVSYNGSITLYNADGKSGVKNFVISNVPSQMNCTLDRSAGTIDIINLSLGDINYWKPVTATIDGDSVAINGNSNVGYSITTRTKLDKGTHTLKLTLDYELSKEQSNYRKISVTRELKFTVN